ncbi:unnamed protein product, partial [Prorocentrum cordatum]
LKPAARGAACWARRRGARGGGGGAAALGPRAMGREGACADDGIRREASHQVLDAKVLPVAATPDGAPQGRSLGLLVMKFSGASLATAESWRRVASIVCDHVDRRPVVVLSAIGQTTNELVNASKRALEDGTVDISAFEAAHRSLLDDLGVPEPEEVTGFFKEPQ